MTNEAAWTVGEALRAKDKEQTYSRGSGVILTPGRELCNASRIRDPGPTWSRTSAMVFRCADAHLGSRWQRRDTCDILRVPP